MTVSQKAWIKMTKLNEMMCLRTQSYYEQRIAGLNLPFDRATVVFIILKWVEVLQAIKTILIS